MVPNNNAGNSSNSNSGSNVTFNNNSSYAIYYLYMSATSDDSWGSDHLGDEVVMPGDGHTIRNVACDNYDIKIVDEDDDECELRNERFCDEDAVYNISNDQLLACQGYGE